ncbi:protein yicc [hydrocarbon metagenome]|uniref:Protein yicc n=1 Tax=hydrocarbon metagenome TaxID=938273 RepID=A0A0W8G7W5_9ZZZZ
MPKSMTGFGRSRLENDAFTQTWEVRGINSRFLDLKWRLPLFLRCRETQLEKVVREYATRGRIEIHLHFQSPRPEIQHISLNRPVALAMLDQLASLAAERGAAFSPDVNRLLSVSALWQEDMDEPDPTLVAALSEGLRAALADFSESRAKEGRCLAGDILTRLSSMDAWCEELARLAPGVKQERTDALLARIRTAMEKAGAEASEERLLQETAILADRLDVSEELTRLAEHLKRLRRLLAEGGEMGKKLDFLIQETFREINTCGNKAQSMDVSRLVVDFKAELEKCREQAQNIE